MTIGLFMSRCHWSIDHMRRAGINETIISCILTEIRSAAISEEYWRVGELLRGNPPTHLHNQEMADKIAEWCPISPTTPDQT